MAEEPLRVAFYGGIANNCYLACKRMRELGVDAVYVRDHLDNYAMSQPLWEDHRFALPYEAVLESSQWTAADWDRRAEETGWRPPAWIVDPMTLMDEAQPDFTGTPGIDLTNYTPAPADHYRKIIAYFQTFDLIFVSNAHAVILALLAGRPFVICPAGGEFLIATDQIKAEGAVGTTYLQQGKLLRAAFLASRSVLTSTAYHHNVALTGGMRRLVREFPPRLFDRISLPFIAMPPVEPGKRRALLNDLLGELGCGPVKTRFSIFVPSRVDFRWKGQDRLMSAIEQTPEAEQFTFIFSSWGADYEALSDWAKGRTNICLLPSALSKPLLYEFYRASDVVVDQFTLGHIGTAAREAVAAGAPVMAYIQQNWLTRLFGRQELPVLRAQTAGEIGAWFSRIARDEVDLAGQSRRGRAWIERYATPQAMHAALRAAVTG